MKLIRKAGATSEIWQIFISDSSSTTGAGLTGLAFNTSGLTAYYHRDTDTTATVITLATMTVGTFTSSGFKEIDATNMPGWYQFCPPNAALASGAKSCGFHLKGATNMAPLPIEVDLASQVDVTSWNGTAVASPATAGIPDINVKNINNVAAATPGASGGILISGANSGTTTLGALTVTGATTLTGAVSLGSTLGVTGTITLAAVNTGAIGTGNITVTGTLGTTGTVTFNAFTVTNAFSINGVSDVAQTGDNFARIGVAGAGLTNLGDARIANLDATVSSRLASASYTAPLTAATTRSAIGLATANLDTQLAALDADILTRMATYTQPTGFLATSFPASVASPTNITAGTVTLLSTGLDAVLVESGIGASAALTNDAGAQLTSINARQAIALGISALGGLLSGAGTTSVAIKPGGNPSGNTRVAATVDSSGNRTASNIKVPT